MSSTVIGTEDAVVNKADMISYFVESKVQWVVR